MFIRENHVVYTQIFNRLIQRFLKMDLSLSKNAFMLFRLMKVFRQLTGILHDIEKEVTNNNSSAIRSRASFNDSAITSTPPRTPNSLNRSNSHLRSHNQSAIEDGSFYVHMFNDEATMMIYELMQRLYLAKLKTIHEVEGMEKEMNKHSTFWEKLLQFVGWFSSLSLSFSMTLEDKKKTPMYLDFSLNVLSTSFNIQIDDITREFKLSDTLQEESDDERDISMVGSDYLNITPSFMKQKLRNITFTGDPFLLPIMSYEVKFLVRFLYQVSCKLNEMVRNLI